MLTEFGKYLKERGIRQADAARALGISRQRVGQLRWVASSPPGLSLAADIQVWSEGEVAIESWLVARDRKCS